MILIFSEYSMNTATITTTVIIIIIIINWRNRTTKSRQDQNTRRKRDLQILRNLGGWHYQTSRNEKQNSKRISQEN